MKLLDELRSLDPRDPGRWPLAVRAGAVGVSFVVLSLLCSWYFVWQNKQPELEQLQNQEQTLRDEFRSKHAKATNLDVYKQQLADIEKSFGAMLRQLPSKTEVDNLLVDISQTGLAAALEEKLFQPQTEVKQDFYAERPIKIRLTGSYHQFGAFVSGIAALPRIVTLHDVEIKPVDKSASYDQLQMDLTAKTYRYLDDEEVQAVEAEKRKAAQQQKRAGASTDAGS
jgi:type IV pilus assembly protein PilO